MDGNKRTGCIVAATFLALNGWLLNTTDAEVVQVFLNIANGATDEVSLAKWFENHITQSKLEN